MRFGKFSIISRVVKFYANMQTKQRIFKWTDIQVLYFFF